MARTLELDLGDRSLVLVPVDIARPHRHRERFAWPGGSDVLRLVVRGGGPDVDLATIALPGAGPRSGADQLEIELVLFPDGTTMAVLTDVESRASSSTAFRLA